jgi:hypothetical protein
MIFFLKVSHACTCYSQDFHINKTNSLIDTSLFNNILIELNLLILSHLIT